MTARFQNFAESLFPGDTIYEPNGPLDALPDDVAEILGGTARATGVPENWLARLAKLVIDGLAGAQCLWFLHGLHGTVKDEYPDPPVDHLDELRKLKYAAMETYEKKARPGWSAQYKIDWGKGEVVPPGEFPWGETPVIWAGWV